MKHLIKFLEEKTAKFIKNVADFPPRNPDTINNVQHCCPYCGSKCSTRRNPADDRDWFIESHCKNPNCSKNGFRRFCNDPLCNSMKEDNVMTCDGWPWKEGKITTRDLIAAFFRGLIKGEKNELFTNF